MHFTSRHLHGPDSRQKHEKAFLHMTYYLLVLLTSPRRDAAAGASGWGWVPTAVCLRWAMTGRYVPLDPQHMFGNQCQSETDCQCRQLRCSVCTAQL